MINFIKKHRIFIAFSLVVATIDTSFVAITYFQAKNNLHIEEQQKARSHFSAFDLAMKATKNNMLQISNIVANTPLYQDLFSQGKAAVALEGGGSGQEKSAKIRAALNDAIQPLWKQFVDKFHARQLQFLLGPGATSFLRVHQPAKFGDNMDKVRHTIVDTNKYKVAVSGFEIGRVYSGIRGTSPVSILTDAGTFEYVGAVEAGISFTSVLNYLTTESNSHAAILLSLDYFKANVWPEYFLKIIKQTPPINNLILEETTSNDIRQLESLSRSAEHKPSNILDTNIDIQLIGFKERQILYMTRPLRDYAGSRDIKVPDVGKIVIWEDITDLVATFNHNLKINIYYSIVAFFLIEILLFFAIRLVKQQLNQIIHKQTVELTSRNQILEQFAKGDDLPTILKSIALVVEKEIPDFLCSIQLVSLDGRCLITGASPSIPEFYNTEISGVEISKEVGSFGVAARRKARVVIENIQSSSFDVNYKKIAKKAKFISCWSEPIFANTGEILGVFSLYHHENCLPVPSEIIIIESIIQFTSMVIEQRISNEALQLHSRIYEQTHDGIVITNSDGNIIDINNVFTVITGYEREDVIGKNPALLSSGKQSAEFYVDMWKAIDEVGYWQGEVWNRKKSGEVFAEYLTISSIKNKQNAVTHYVGLFSDITVNKEQQKSLELMAHYDVLTQLPNRILFMDRFHQAIAHSKRSNTLLAVCFLDLDEFKPVNDSFGHDVGDQLLIEVATRIKANIREEDTVSRQGGDEFALLLGNIDSPFQNEQMLKRLNKSLATPFVINGNIISISASIGVSLCPDDSEDLDILLRNADQAMYQAKLSGRNKFHLFNAESDKQTSEKQSQLQEIEQALSNNQFSLYYQPKVNMKTGTVYGVEALIRWHHPEKGLILPLDFLPLIENTELEYKVGKWVIIEALNQLDFWLSQGIEIAVSVNISSNHIQSPDFFDCLDKALSLYPNIPGKLLQLEILESSALGDLQTISDIIHQCQNTLGVHFALDDFGTGYSSLTHLRNLSVDTIKIDQSFVRDMLDDPDDYSIIEGVIGLAASFNREVIAEGVESTEHGIMLLIMGCYFAQGYSIAKPIPANDFMAWLDKYQPNKEWMNFANQNRTNKENKIKLLKMTTVHWFKNFENEINDTDVTLLNSLILEHHKCHHGAWIQKAKQEHVFNIHWLNQLEKAHKNMHVMAKTLMNERQDSSNKIDLNQLYDAYKVLHALLDEYK